MNRTELKNKKIAVLMGGLSAEREISLKTGQAVLGALLKNGCNAVAIDAGHDLPAQLREVGTDVAFICLHGRYGEDGTVQGLLEMMRIPYTGSGVMSSSMVMDKVITKQILLYHEISTPGFVAYRSGDDRSELFKRCRHFPLVVKPAREGSTIGISIVHDRAELDAGLEEALEHDDLVLIEDYIQGDEITVSILNKESLPIIQIVPKSGFYDYESKYTPGNTEYLLPAPLEAVLYNRLQETSLAACKALACRGAARVDFMVREREFFCLEVNTIPGMTATSLLPKAAAQAGISFNELVMQILEDAGLNK
ncbi:MAG: D-alanine--D-alanine ligase [Deltaproteobacteria bacterium]|nr:MAG: D-alanine--D-alanine ligase [Deltaproteobacteria bacterium]